MLIATSFCHQALDIGHICQQREDLQSIDELPGFFLTALGATSCMGL